LLLGYDEIGFGPLHFSKSAGQKTEPVGPERDKKIKNAQPQTLDPKKEDRVAEPAKPIEEKSGVSAPTKTTDKTLPQRNKIGPPLGLTPQIVENGVVWVIVPIQQGDEDEDNPDKLPKGAFEENGRWFMKVPLKCETLGGLPMPNEACAASRNSPGGRPVLRQ
jgi:hypothetical protein